MEKAENRPESPFCVKIEHLKKSCEFRDILANGIKWQGTLVTLYSKQEKNAEKADIRIGTIITKKLVPKATRRNYIRRLIYSFFAEQKMKINPGFSSVVKFVSSFGTGAKKTLSKEIRRELAMLAEKAGVLQQ